MKKPSQLIKEVGWCQNAYVKREDGKIIGYCLVGAIETAYKDFPSLLKDCYCKLEEVRAMKKIRPLIVWNDEEVRTKEEVVSFLQKAGF